MSTGTITAPPGAITTAFPTAAVEAQLRSSLVDVVDGTAAISGVALPADAVGKCAASVQIDSLDVVDILCGVEGIVGFELKDSIVKAGGYKSINEAIGHVLPRIQSAWQKQQGKGSK